MSIASLLWMAWAIPANLCAQSGPQLQISTDVLQFKESDSSYVEIQNYIAGSSLSFTMSTDSQWTTAVDILLYFMQDSQLVLYDHFILHSPPSKEPGKDFLDIRRYRLPPGRYALHLEAFGLQNPTDTLALDQWVDIKTPVSEWELSDAMLLRSALPATKDHPLARNGYALEPLPFRFYPRTADMLLFFQEIYCLDRSLTGSPVHFGYYLETGPVEAPQRIMQAISKKRKSRSMDPLLIQMDISGLPSGNYRLVSELRDSTLSLKASTKVAFQRSNPGVDMGRGPQDSSTASGQETFLPDLDESSLNYALRATAPRVWDSEVEMLNLIIRNPDLRAKRFFLHRFFSRENPANPTKGYEDYMAIARVIDKEFLSGFGFGFESDRGFAIMKYGRPNDIIDVEDEPHAPPYQIWLYNEFPYTGQRNVKFLFFNPSLAPGNYVLLHSTARNEKRNPRWEIELYGKLGPNEIEGNNFQDATGVRDQYYRRARQFFEDN